MYKNSDVRPLAGLWGIILGGSSGFGLAGVAKLAEKGMNLAVLYRETAAPSKKLAGYFAGLEQENGIRILSFNVNALDKESRTGCIRQISEKVKAGSVKLLLHSIARGNLKPLTGLSVTPSGEETGVELSTEDMAATSYAMSYSLLDWCRAVLGAGLFHADARIIGLTSEGAHKHWEGYAAVSIAKASLESLATYMAVEFGRYGLKTNLIQAGITETPSLRRIPGSDELLRLTEIRNPMGRITKPEDVANVIYLLCTDEAFWINGALIHVDGGEHCR